jgi:hypothetical protein
MEAHDMPFYPPDAVVPEERRTARLWLRPLRASDVALDYDAVMGSAEQLRRWSQSSWPADDFTLEENLVDLQRHQREHLERVAFTYTVLNPEGDRCLGCVYIMPPRPAIADLDTGAAYPADVAFWARTSELAGDLDRHLLAAQREWFRDEWAFDRVLWRIGRQETRQAEIMRDAGLEQLLDYVLPDGRPCLLFGEAAKSR